MEPTILILAAMAALVFFLIIFGLLSIYRKVGPNQALIVYGRGGAQVHKAGATFVLPWIQSARELSLELMSFDVAPQQDLYTLQGVAVTVEAVTQLKIKSDRDSILTAAEQLLNKNPLERENLIRLVMEGHLRGIVGQLTVEQIVKEPEMVGSKMRSTVAEDLNKMGLEVISFTIREVRDKNEYISNMGRPDIARIRRDADIASAEADRDTAVRRAQAAREASVAAALANQERVIAETASQTRQAEAQRDLELKKAEYAGGVRTAQAQADKAYDIQANIQQQQVVIEQVRIERVRREEETRVQLVEIQRRENELIATILKPAEIERQRIQTLAEAERQRRTIEAEGEAAATRAQGAGAADANRIQGLAEADVIRAKGQAEADAMTLRAAAFNQYNQAAILDKLLSQMPEIVRAIAAPLNNVDKITIVSTGDSDNTGASRITGDVARIVAQVPAMFETLTGVRVNDLISHLRPVDSTATRVSSNGNGSHSSPDDGNTLAPLAGTTTTTTTTIAPTDSNNPSL